jgi:hypothetical protein
MPPSSHERRNPFSFDPSVSRIVTVGEHNAGGMLAL